MNEKIIEELLCHIVKAPAKASKRLLDHFGTAAALTEAEPEEIADVLDGDMATAIYLRLAVCLASRRESDKFAFGKKHTEGEIENYLKAFFFGMSVETVAVISIDAVGKVISIDKAGEGTVNFSNVMPRKILEISKRRRAKSLIIAHNHPGGYPYPSDDDMASAKLLSEMLVISGVEVLQNYVVAGSECAKINI